MGTPVNIPESNRDNCPKISTSCVIWQGPNIPCINLCTGDSIDEVVFKLATILCNITTNVLDITTLNLACLVQSGSDAPDTLMSVIQAIILKVCEIDANGTTGGNTGRPGNDNSEPTVDLPTCLYFRNNDGDLVTSMLITDYSAFLATYICTLITSVNNINGNLSQLNSRVTTLEEEVINLSTFNYQIYVVSQCASAPTPGTTLLIQDAFSNLEATVCGIMGTLGTSTALVAAINKQCPNLGVASQLQVPSRVMNQLTGWVNTPTSLPDTLTNMWLTICDMRGKMATFFSTPPSLPCILVAPENVTITTVTTTYATVTWSAPSVLSSILAPFSYRVEVFAWTGSAPTGPSVFNATIPAGTYTQNITSVSITSTQDYVVYVHAMYDCGESNGSAVIGHLLDTTILYKVKVTEATTTTTTTPCVESGSPVTYNVLNKITTVQLTNAITGSPVTNGGTSPINVVVRYQVTSCAFYGSVFDDVTIAIPVGSNNGTYTYSYKTYTNCGTPTCTEVHKDVHCGLSISDMHTAFDTTTITVCV